MGSMLSNPWVIALIVGVGLDAMRDQGPPDTTGKPGRAPWKVTAPFIRMQMPTLLGGVGGIF